MSKRCVCVCVCVRLPPGQGWLESSQTRAEGTEACRRDGQEDPLPEPRLSKQVRVCA